MNSDLEREAFSLRLRESLAKLGKTGHRPTDLAREFNRRYPGEPITLHAARKWLLGEAIPTQEKLLILARWLGVTPEWLRFGESQATVLKANEIPASYDFQLMQEIAGLSEGHQQAVRDLVDALQRAEKS